MAIERDGYDGPVTFACDSCGELDETRCTNFQSAIAKLKSHGWAIVKEDDGWAHYCHDCHPFIED